MENTSNKRIEVTVTDNVYFVHDAQSSFTLLIDDSLIDLSKSVSIEYNCETLFSEIITPDLETMISTLLSKNDKHMIYIAAI